MLKIIAALGLFMPYVGQIQSGVIEMVALINAIRTAAKQAGLWTPEMDAECEAALLATKNDPAYQQDKPTAT